MENEKRGNGNNWLAQLHTETWPWKHRVHTCTQDFNTFTKTSVSPHSFKSINQLTVLISNCFLI